MFEKEITYIKVIRSKLPDLFENAMLSQQKEIVGINRANLSGGKLSTGGSIVPKYSDAYAKKKGIRTPNLKVTGEFHKSIYVTPTNKDEVLITSDETRNGFPLAAHLSEKYTQDIYGVGDNDADKIKEKAFEQVINIIDDGFKS